MVVLTQSRYFALIEMMKDHNWKRGQVGLLLLVVVGLIIGIVMSVASRSLTDTALSRKEKENTSAFAIAESGVEAALSELAQGGGSATWTTITGSDPTGIYSAMYAVDQLNSFEMAIEEGESVEIDVSPSLTGNLTIYWTKLDSSQENVVCGVVEGSGLLPAALGVAVVNGTNTVRRNYYDAASCDVSTNGFPAANVSTDNTYKSMATYVKQAGDVVVRLTPIYNDATIKVVGTGLTEAMFRVASVGSGGDSQKEIQVKRSRDAAGSVFDFAVFSGSTIMHN